MFSPQNLSHINSRAEISMYRWKKCKLRACSIDGKEALMHCAPSSKLTVAKVLVNLVQGGSDPKRLEHNTQHHWWWEARNSQGGDQCGFTRLGIGRRRIVWHLWWGLCSFLFSLLLTSLHSGLGADLDSGIGNILMLITLKEENSTDVLSHFFGGGFREPVIYVLAEFVR